MAKKDLHVRIHRSSRMPSAEQSQGMPGTGISMSSAFSAGRNTNGGYNMNQLPNHRRMAKGRKHMNPKY